MDAQQQPLDRTSAPSVPDAVADLWHGWGYNGGDSIEQVKAALDGVTSIVNALSGEGRQYSVALTKIGTAATDLKTRRVQITTAALMDKRLTMIERVAVTTSMAVHEAGHARLTAPMSRAVCKRWADTDPQAALAYRLSNIIEDVRLEDRTGRSYPAYAGLFPLAMWWVAQRYPSGKVEHLPESQAQAVNMALAAIRYGDLTDWSTDAAIQSERTWWVKWGQKAAQHDKAADHVAAIEAALARYGYLPMQVERPQPPEQPERPEQGEDGEDEDGDDQPGGKAQSNEAEPDEWDLPKQADEPDDESDEPHGPSPRAERSEDEDDESESDEDDGEDEDGDAAGDADDDEDDEDAQGEGDDDDDASTKGDQSDEPDDDGWQDDGDEADGGEVTMRHHDEAVSGDLSESDEDGDEMMYGPSEDPNFRGGEEGKVEQADALADPLPMHATDAVTDDDRNRDMAMGTSIEADAKMESRDSIFVTHGGAGSGVRVGIIPLTTSRSKIVTNMDAQGAIRAAFVSRRTSHDARNVARSGRISGSRAYRVRAGFDNVFTRRDALSPDRLDVHLLVDASGSMSSPVDGHRPRRWSQPRTRQSDLKVVDMAARCAANITEALAYLPNVRVHVWSHNDIMGTTLWDVYDSRAGQNVGRIAGIKAGGGNNDASAIAALTARILKERSSRERSIMVVISDGAPCEPEPWVLGAAEKARQQGIGVVSVAISGGLTKTQEACYGATNVVPWTGDWDMLARGMAQIIGRLA